MALGLLETCDCAVSGCESGFSLLDMRRRGLG